MPEITADTNTRDLVVQGVTLEAPTPYEAGHTLTDNEAHVINQTWLENLRNNFAPIIKKYLDNGELKSADELSVEQRTELQSKFDAYSSAYEFGVRTGGGRVSLDPVQAQAMQLAVQQVKKSLKAKNFKLKDVGMEKVNELAAAAIEKNPKFLEKGRE